MQGLVDTLEHWGSHPCGFTRYMVEYALTVHCCSFTNSLLTSVSCLALCGSYWLDASQGDDFTRVTQLFRFQTIIHSPNQFNYASLLFPVIYGRD